MTIAPLSLLLALAAIFAGTFLQRISGMGVGLVAGPALGFILGPQVGIYATNIVAVTTALLLTVVRWRGVDWRRVAWVLLAAVPGAVVAAIMVRELPTAWLQILLGGTVFFALILTSVAKNLPARDGRSYLVGAGFFGGILNGTVGIAAPAMVIYARMARWRQPGFGASLQPVFLVMGVLSVFFKTVLGSLGPASSLPAWWYLPIAVGVALLAALAGGIASRKISSEIAQRIAGLLAIFGAVVVLIRGIIGLFWLNWHVQCA